MLPEDGHEALLLEKDISPGDFERRGSSPHWRGVQHLRKGSAELVGSLPRNISSLGLSDSVWGQDGVGSVEGREGVERQTSEKGRTSRRRAVTYPQVMFPSPLSSEYWQFQSGVPRPGDRRG